MTLESERSRGGVRDLVLERLRTDESLLGGLERVPAFWHKGVEEDVEDISIAELLRRYFGIGGEERENTRLMAGDIGVDRYTLISTANNHLEVVRALHFADELGFSTRLTHRLAELTRDTWVARVAEFKAVYELFSRHENDADFQMLLATPVFNKDRPPLSVMKAAVATIRDGGQMALGSVPTLGGVLRAYYGMGVERKLPIQISVMLGYKRTPKGFYRVLDGTFQLLNARYGTSFTVRDEKRSYPEAEAIETKSRLLTWCLGEGFFEAEYLQQYPVTGNIRRLIGLGLPIKRIAALADRYLLSVSQHQSRPILRQLVYSVDQELRGLVPGQSGVEFDKWEKAARLLQAFEAGLGFNQRAQLVVDILYLLQEGLKVKEVFDGLGIGRGHLYQLLAEARMELEGEAQFRAELERVCWEECGTAKIDEETPTWFINAVYRRLYPIYRAYREFLGDRPEENEFTKLSPRERMLLKLMAQGKSIREISQVVVGRDGILSDHRQWGLNARALLESDFGESTSIEERREEIVELLQLLRSASQDIEMRSMAYPTQDRLLARDIDILEQLVAYDFSWARFVDSTDYRVVHVILALRRARVLRKNLQRGEGPAWRIGAANWEGETHSAGSG